MKTRMLSLLLVALFSSTLYAGSLSEFSNKFTYEKNDQGEIVRIISNELSYRPRIKIFVDGWKNILEEFKSSSQNHESKLDIEEFLNKAALEEEIDPKFKGIVKKVLKTIEEKDLINNLNHPEVQSTFNKFERELFKLNERDYKTVANLKNRKFFYKKNSFKSALKSTLKFAKKMVTVPLLLDLSMDIVFSYIDALNEAKRFSQSSLLYYLSNFSAADLGLTEREKKHALSSIMESNIDWHSYKQHKRAVKKWNTFGEERLAKMEKKARKRLKKHRKKYSRSSSHGSFFILDTTRNRNKIYNIYNKKSFFSSKPSLSYDYNKPHLVRNMRVMYKLVAFASGFTGIPGFSYITGKYLDTHYEDQTRQEGYLHAHFEANGNTDMTRNLIHQSINPLMILR